MRKNILIAVIFFLLGVTSTKIIPGVSSSKQATTQGDKLVSQTTSPSPTPCGRDDRYIETKGLSDDELNKRLFGDVNAIKFVKDNCLIPFNAYKANIITSNQQSIVFWASGIGCGSCHAQTLYIFDNGKKVYEDGFDDPKISVLKRDGKLDALEIMTPIRTDGEPLCCPIWGLKTDYEWFTYDNKSTLVKTTQIPEKYN